MGRERFNLSHNTGEEIIELIIRDTSGAKIDSFKFSMKDFSKLVNIIEKKYGVSARLPRDRDLEWLKDDSF